MWWATFLSQWNGRSAMPATSPSVTVTSDMSGSWGCEAMTSDVQWLQLQWPQSWGDVHIATKEMVPVVIALALWGKCWQGCAVLCQSDNNGSGGCVENRVSQGQAADAPAALSAFLHSSCPTMHCGYPHPREVKHGGRCHFT